MWLGQHKLQEEIEDPITLTLTNTPMGPSYMKRGLIFKFRVRLPHLFAPCGLVLSHLTKLAPIYL